MKSTKRIGWVVVLACAVVAMAGCRSNKQAPSNGKSVPGVQGADFGRTKDGRNVEIYTLTNKKGAVAKIMNYGATLTELHVPDRNGQNADVVLGFSDFARYEAGHPFFGSTAGRVANRIGKGRFMLDGKEYTLFVNNAPNSLHGGKVGFDKKVWHAEPVKSPEVPAVSCVSFDT